MRITIRQLKLFISEAVRTAHIPSFKRHKSELARLKKIIKEEIEDAAKVDPITKDAAALPPEEARMELEEILRDAPPELLQKLQDLVRDPEFREIKSSLNEGEHTGALAVTAVASTTMLAFISSMIAQYGINDPSSGMSPQAVMMLTGLLAATTIGAAGAAIASAIKGKR